MDIERLKKINALAKNLLENSIVATMDEAYAQAERMIEKGGGVLNEDVFVHETRPEEKEIEVRQMNSPVQAVQTQLVPQQEPVNLLELKTLGERIGEVEQQLDSLFSKMNEIINEINRLHEKIETRTAVPQSSSQQEVKTEAPQVSPQSPAPANTQKTQSTHPRTGDYKPGDVAIEKMFYFGGAR